MSTLPGPTRTMDESELCLCSSCRAPKAATEFRRRSRSEQAGRLNQCRECHNAAERARRAERRREQIRGFTRQLQNSPDDAAVFALCRAMLASFDSPLDLAERWHALLTAAKPGSRIALAAFNALVRLMAACENRHQETNPADDASQLTDEQLFAQVAALMASVPQ